MKIICIGWGSLIWDKRDLNVEVNWQTDGPLLPIEFARQSSNCRVTLVICDNAKPVTTLWTTFKTSDLRDAVESLRIREGTTIANIHTIDINEDKTGDKIKETIRAWLVKKNFDAAVWTGLKPKFNNIDGKKPSLKELIAYLKNLDRPYYELAQEYVRRAPEQIKTEFRCDIQTKMHW